MAVIGVELEQDELVLTKGRDFRWTFTNLDSSGSPTAFPSGSLYFEVYTSVPKTWTFSISGSTATIKVESDEVATVPARTKWQLVFRPSGEAAGGDPIARGTVRIQE